MGIFRPPQREEWGIEPPLPAAPRPGLATRVFRSLPWELRLLLVAPIYLGIPGIFWLAGMFAYYTATIPDPMSLRQRDRPPVVRILDRDGAVLAERNATEAYIPLDVLPGHLIDAVVATEDRRFFEHWGIDPTGLTRAIIANMRAGRIAQGGSTLTQQLAKNLFLSSDRTYARKLEEMVLALWLEVRLGKREILELYLNRVYFGAGAYGIETAAQRFFGKPAHDLSLTESAVIAGLLKAPSKYSPASNPANARARARNVLSKMVEAKMLGAEEGEVAALSPIRFADSLYRPGQSGVEYAVDYALERLPPLANSGDGELTVETTIDGRLQRRAQSVVQDLMDGEGRSLSASQAGMAMLDLDGGIRVLVGGRTYVESQFNRAIKAKRQPGSTFKPFVYLAALEKGMTADSIVQDAPFSVRGWSPRNENGQYRGNVTLRDALAYSMNAAAARLAMSIGPKRVAAVAHRLGIQSDLRIEGSLALGTSEVSLLELTSAYGVLASGGKSLSPHIVTRVRTESGRVLYERPMVEPKMLLPPTQVGAMNDMLNAALVAGTGKRAALPRHPAAGKTGTSQDFRDAWFVGYTAHLVAGVWVGNDDSKPMSRVMGGNLPARLWHEVMGLAHQDLTPLSLPGTVPTTPMVAMRANSIIVQTGSVRETPARDVRDPDPIGRVISENAHVIVPERKSEPPPTWGQRLWRSLGFGA